MNQTTELYGALWPAGADQLQIELACIQQGGHWKDPSGKVCGAGLFTHYRNAQTLCWPDDNHHRWSDLALKTMVEEEISVFLGSGDSGKTYSMSRFVLIDWWAFPETTLWLVSSTEYRGAELRIWGAIKDLFNRARDRYDWLPGNVLESMHAITTENIDDDRQVARSLRKGLILVPCKKGGEFVGLGAYVGIKSPRLRHAGDECQHMATGFLDAYSNWYGKPNFKGIMSGNPLDESDPLCTAAEPVEGWENWKDTGKTQTWRSRFFKAKAVAFDGRDTPNNDFPKDQPLKYPYLISDKKMNAIAETHGKDSWQWFNQVVGKPNQGLVIWRVITRQMCEQHGAFDQVIWFGSELTRIYALDPAYGGGDDCVGIPIEFGLDVNQKDVIRIGVPELVPINLRLDEPAEDQIARYTKKRLEMLNIPVENCGYDSFGKGTLGYSFARIFGSNTPVPIDSGAMPTNRPVRFDLFIEDTVNGGKVKRLKTCREHYSKFITEMWFSVAECIQSDQLKELDKLAMQEGAKRIYQIVKGNRLEIEPKKDYKERVGQSPNRFDALAVGIEMARRRGFRITRIGGNVESAPTNNIEWFTSMQSDRMKHREREALNYSA